MCIVVPLKIEAAVSGNYLATQDCLPNQLHLMEVNDQVLGMHVLALCERAGMHTYPRACSGHKTHC